MVLYPTHLLSIIVPIGPWQKSWILGHGETFGSSTKFEWLALAGQLLWGVHRLVLIGGDDACGSVFLLIVGGGGWPSGHGYNVYLLRVPVRLAY